MVSDEEPHDESLTALDVAAFEAAFRDAIRGMHSLADILDTQARDWRIGIFLLVVQEGLAGLRHCIEDEGTPEVSWESPFVEVRYDADWDFDGRLQPNGGLVTSRFTSADLVDGKIPAEVWTTAFVNHATLIHLQELTRGVVEWHETGVAPSADRRPGYRLPQALHEALNAQGLEGEARRNAVSELTQPFTIGTVPERIVDEATLAFLNKDLEGKELTFEDLQVLKELTLVLSPPAPRKREKKDRPRITLKSEGPPAFDVEVVVQVHPLNVDADLRRAWFPVVVGLAFKKGEPSSWTKDEQAAFWKDVDDPLAKQAEKWLRFRKPRKSTRDTKKTEAPEGVELIAVAEAVEDPSRESEPLEGDHVARIHASASTDEPLPREPEVFPVAPARRAALAATFPVAFGRAKADHAALEIVRNVHKVNLSGRKWSSYPSWEELIAGEVERLREDLGEDAFTRSPALLRRRYRDGGRTEVVELTAEAEKTLKIRQGLGTGFRYRNPRTREESLVRLFQVGSGYVEVGLSWFGMAGPLVADYRKKLAEKARELSEREPFLFAELDEEQREDADRFVRRARVFEDAQKLMEAILGQVGRQAQNPVRVPAFAFRTLLRVETDPNGKARVEEALNALRACSFSVNSFGTGEKLLGEGSFLGEWWYEGAGPGDHAAGDYFLDVQPGFLGCLNAYESNKRRLDSGREVVTYDFGKTLSSDERKALGWGSDRKHDGRRVTFEKRKPKAMFDAFDAGRVFYNAAAGLTPAQEGLVAFLEREETRNGSTVSRYLGNHAARRASQAKAGTPEAHEARRYGNDECPLLPAGKRFVAALGNFRPSPESGRTLAGTPRREGESGGAHAAGLLHEMGYTLPPGAAHAQRHRIARQALEDLKAVVVDYLGGVVVVRAKGKNWLTLEEASRLPEGELIRQARFFLFLPETWRADRLSKWEAHQAERAERGETPFAWKGTEDRGQADRARLALRAHAAGDREASSPEGTPTEPLHKLLRAARLERGLTLAQVGELFGVSFVSVSKWEAGPDPDESGRAKGKPVSAELAPLIRRWVATGEEPSADELAARRTARFGVNPETGRGGRPRREHKPQEEPL